MILDLIVIGLAISLEPVPLTSFVLVLGSQNGLRKGAAFVSGWFVSLSIVVAVTLLATGDSPPKSSTAPSVTALAVKIVIGVALLLIALRQYRRLGRPKKQKKPPKWQQGLDTMSPFYAFGLATLVQPWGLIAAGIATIVEAKLASLADYLAIIFFCLLATGTYLSMEIYAAARPTRMQESLARLRIWLDTHTDQLIIWVSLIAGLWLVGKSTYVIVS
jgi:hypothetical protein